MRHRRNPIPEHLRSARGGFADDPDTLQHIRQSLVGEDRNCDNETYENLDLRHIDFREASLVNTKFINCDLRGCGFLSVILENTQFKNSDLRKAYIRPQENTQIGDSNFEGTDCRGAHFQDTHLRNLQNFNLANIDSAVFNSTAFFEEFINYRTTNTPKFQIFGIPIFHSLKLLNLDLRGVNMNGMSIENSDFTDTDLQGASLQDANLTKCSFMGANLENVNFENALLKHAEFGVSTQFKNTSFLSADLSNANLSRIEDLSTSCLWDSANLEKTSVTDIPFLGFVNAHRTIKGIPTQDFETLSVYRGAPKGCSTIFELDGGARGDRNEMLGAGLYTSQDRELAEYYAPSKDDDAVYQLMLQVSSNLILDVSSDTIVGLNLYDPNVGDASEASFLNTRIPPFAKKVENVVYVFGLTDETELDLYVRARPMRIRITRDIYLAIPEPIRSELSTNVELIDFLRTRLDGEYEISEYFAQNLAEDFAEDDDRFENDQHFSYLLDICKSAVACYIEDFGSGRRALANDMTVDESKVFFADLSELSGIASEHSYAILSVSDILPYNETVILDLERIEVLSFTEDK